MQTRYLLVDINKELGHNELREQCNPKVHDKLDTLKFSSRSPRKSIL